MLEMGLLVGLFAMLFFTPYTLCKGIHILAYDSIDTKDKLMCMIPVVNIFRGEVLYTGKAPTVGISTVAFFVLFLLRVVEAFAGAGTTIANITIILLVISMLALYVTNFILVFRILKEADVTGFGAIIVFSLLYPIGQYYIGNLLPRVLKNSLKDDQTFI